MRPVQAALFSAGLLLVALGGCLGAGEDPEARGEGDDAGDSDGAGGKSSIEGRVVTEAFTPIQGALVQASQGGVLAGRATTDEQGDFVITDLESGEYVVQVSAPCCKEQVYRVHPAPGATSRIAAVLEELPRIVPYVEEDSWQGLLACGIRYPEGTLGTNQCDNTDPNADRFHAFKVREGLETIVFAMDWEPSNTNLLGELRVLLTKGTETAGPSPGSSFFVLEGPPPLEIVLGPQDATGGEAFHFEAIEGAWDVNFNVWVGGEPVNVAYQQPFTIYYQLHYLAPAPSGASALPG